MRIARRCMFAAAALCAASAGVQGWAAPLPAAASAAARFGPAPGPLAVAAMDLEWRDPDRNRTLPVRIFFPRSGDGPFPALVLAPGVGAGNAAGGHVLFEFLGRHLASHGYIAVHLRQVAADGQPGKPGGGPGGATTASGESQAGVTRLLDLVFAIDQVVALQSGGSALRGRIDLKNLAVGGNNVAAWTALAAAGLAHLNKRGEETSLPDPRVKALVLMVPTASPDAEQRARLRFSAVQVPCLHLLGTFGQDAQSSRNAQNPKPSNPQPQPPKSPKTPQLLSAADRLLLRRYAFDHIAGPDQAMVTFFGGPSAAERRGPFENAAQLQGEVKTAATAFLDAYLKHDAAAREWLMGGGLAAAVGSGGRVETMRSR
jgi:hypothetical protein